MTTTRRAIRRILNETATPQDVRRWAGVDGEVENIGSGYHGTAYHFNGQVLKITDDEREAEASAAVLESGGKLLNVVGVNKVGQIDVDEFAIVYEYIPGELTLSEERVATFFPRVARSYVNHVNARGEDIEKNGYYIAWPQITNVSGFVEYFREYIRGTAYSEVAGEPSLDRMITDVLRGLSNLYEIGVEYSDVHEGNIRKNDYEKYVVIDLGESISKRQPMIPDIPEGGVEEIRRIVFDMLSEEAEENVLVVVHPDSLAGSADFLVGERAIRIRERIADQVDEWDGPVVTVADPEWENEAEEYPDVRFIHDHADQQYDSDLFDDNLRDAARRVLDDYPKAKFTVTGAWVEPGESGCVRAIASELGGDVSPESAVLESLREDEPFRLSVGKGLEQIAFEETDEIEDILDPLTAYSPSDWDFTQEQLEADAPPPDADPDDAETFDDQKEEYEEWRDALEIAKGVIPALFAEYVYGNEYINNTLYDLFYSDWGKWDRFDWDELSRYVDDHPEEMEMRYARVLGDEGGWRSVLPAFDEETREDLILGEVPSDYQEIDDDIDPIERAVAQFGTTHDLSCGFYILPDGRVLDGSQGQGYRVADHRQIDYGPGGSETMVQFQQLGPIRLSPEAPGIDLEVPPTYAQEKTIRDVVDWFGEIYVDVFDRERGRKDSGNFENAGRAIQFIRGFYNPDPDFYADEDEDMEESRVVIRNMLDESIGRTSL